MKSVRPAVRILIAALVMAVAETAWALFAASTSIDLLLFYLVLVGASVVFFVPGLAEGHGREP